MRSALQASFLHLGDEVHRLRKHEANLFDGACSVFLELVRLNDKWPEAGRRVAHDLGRIIKICKRIEVC